MPGLMSVREEYAARQPLKGLRIMGSLHMTIQTAVLIETLAASAPTCRWCSCNIFSTQDHAAAAVAVGPKGTPENPKGIPVFAWKGENLEEYWWCTERALDFGDGRGPNQIVDDGGDATLLIHKGVEYENAGKVPSPDATDSEEFKEMLKLLAKSFKKNPDALAQSRRRNERRHRRNNHRRARLYEMQNAGTLLFPAINVNDSVTKSKFDNLYGCRHSLVDGLIAPPTLCSAEKSRSSAATAMSARAAANPFAARAHASSSPRSIPSAPSRPPWKDTRSSPSKTRSPMPISSSPPPAITTSSPPQHMAKMKDKAIVGNIGHFDNEIDMSGLKKINGIRKTNIKPQYDMWTFPDGHSVLILAEGRLLNLGCATGHPSFVMSNSFTNQTIAQIELATNRAKYENKVYILPKHLDEKVARLHLAKVGAKLTKLTADQAKYIGVPVDGPYKSDHYRY